MSFNSTHKSWVTLNSQIHFVVCVSLHACQICVEFAKWNKRVDLCSSFPFIVNLPYAIWCSTGLRWNSFKQMQKIVLNYYLTHAAARNICTTQTQWLHCQIWLHELIMHTLSNDYPVLHQSQIFSGIMWSWSPGFSSPGECFWKSPWIISLTVSVQSSEVWNSMCISHSWVKPHVGL